MLYTVLLCPSRTWCTAHPQWSQSISQFQPIVSMTSKYCTAHPQWSQSISQFQPIVSMTSKYCTAHPQWSQSISQFQPIVSMTSKYCTAHPQWSQSISHFQPIVSMTSKYCLWSPRQVTYLTGYLNICVTRFLISYPEAILRAYLGVGKLALAVEHDYGVSVNMCCIFSVLAKSVRVCNTARP